MNPIQIDCGTCPGKGTRCGDCVLTAFVGMPSRAEPRPDVGIAGVPGWSLERVGPDGWPIESDALPMTESEQRVLDRFVVAGLVTGEEAASVIVRLEPGAWRAATG